MDISTLITGLIIFAGIYVAAVLLEILRANLAKKRQFAKKYSVLQVRVARENETGPLVAEQIFASIHGIYQKIGFWRGLFGATQDKISLEIANIGSNIKFFIAFPAKYKNFIEGQIYAQYPDVEIEEVEDYAKIEEMEISLGNTSNESGEQGIIPIKDLPAIKAKKEFSRFDFGKNVFGAELTFTDPTIYPIKRYAQFEDKMAKLAVDPIAGVTATLAKLNDHDEQAWIQIIVRPMSDKWRILFTKCIKIVYHSFPCLIIKFS